MDKIAVLLPCYNEVKTVATVVKDYKNVLGKEAVIYVYDNNSTDGSAEAAEEAGAIVRHEYKQGKGNVVRRMFREIDAECYIMADADDDQNKDRDNVRKHLINLLYGKVCPCRNEKVEDIKTSEEHGGENSYVGTPYGEDNKGDGQPAPVSESIV